MLSKLSPAAVAAAGSAGSNGPLGEDGSDEARLAAEANAHDRQIREGQQLRDAQNANARANKLEKLGRKDPCIRDLLEEHRANQGAVTMLRQQLVTAQEAAADGAQARTDLDAAGAELIELRGVLGRAQKDLADRAVTIDGLKDQVEALRHERLSLAQQVEKIEAELLGMRAQLTARDAELVKLREQLAQALKPRSK
jgi:chromosome segregation ATPase